MRRLILSLILMALFSAGAAEVVAQEIASVPGEVSEYRVTTARVNIHTCPTLDCETLTTYPEGTPLMVLGSETGDTVQENSEWFLIRDALTGREGYISAALTADKVYEDWQTRPVFPLEISEAMKAVYRDGLARGNNPNAFSKTGDCQNVLPTFLAPFASTENYHLGEFTALQATIDQFAGSFDRLSAATDNGYNVASVLSPLWANRQICNGGETPLQCEERLHNPSIVIINMETWWQQRPASEYEDYLNQIVEFWLAEGVVPIVGTKADNLEGDHGINAAIVRVADRYELPLWNFWLAVQQTPTRGLAEDGFHLTYARDFYDDPVRLEAGWPVRNLSALEAIDAVYRMLNE
jgi:hypothetical protein